MWHSWEKQESNLNNFAESASVQTPCKFSIAGLHSRTSVKTESQARELLSENKRLWAELKEKNELMIALRDQLYAQHRQLEELEKYRDEVERFRSTDQYVDLIGEINKLKGDLREKQILVNFLNEMIENLCDDVLQSEHIDGMEMEIESLEMHNSKLNKENSEMKMQLKILEHDSEKQHLKFDHIDKENLRLKAKLEKTCNKLKEKENSMLSFKKFTQLVNNLQSRISHSKTENLALRNVIDRMKNVADCYENLESENAKLKKTVRELQNNTDQLQQKTAELQHINETEAIREPAQLANKLCEFERQMDAMTDKNTKLKSSLKIYEKVLIENKAYIEQAESRLQLIPKLQQENYQLKESIDRINETLDREVEDKCRLEGDGSRLQVERDRLAEKVQALQVDNANLTSRVSATERDFEESQKDTQDLRRQLQVYKNTVQNQQTTLNIRAEEIHSLMRENEQLKVHLQRCEKQMDACR